MTPVPIRHDVKSLCWEAVAEAGYDYLRLDAHNDLTGRNIRNILWRDFAISLGLWVELFPDNRV